jgi:hypothetical protein
MKKILKRSPIIFTTIVESSSLRASISLGGSRDQPADGIFVKKLNMQ